MAPINVRIVAASHHPSNFAKSAMGDQTEESTLDLQTFAQRREVEGRVHSHEGMLAYMKSKQRSWKKGWYRVAPGKFLLHKYFVGIMQLVTLNRPTMLVLPSRV